MVFIWLQSHKTRKITATIKIATESILMGKWEADAEGAATTGVSALGAAALGRKHRSKLNVPGLLGHVNAISDIVRNLEYLLVMRNYEQISTV
jgi:hypothetical protein